MLNLKLAEAVRPRRNEFGDQGFINEVYLWERWHLLCTRLRTLHPCAVVCAAA